MGTKESPRASYPDAGRTLQALEPRPWLIGLNALPAGATVLDLGRGTGVPISQVLIEHGFNVYGVDASASMIAAFGGPLSKDSCRMGRRRGFGFLRSKF
jgi:SAM-dependent methyltransferase